MPQSNQTTNPLLDTGSLAVAAITLLLFGGALLTKGLTHDLFLEAGVFLVSIKLFVMMHKCHTLTEEFRGRLDQVLVEIRGLSQKCPPGGSADAACTAKPRGENGGSDA